ncbi:hypothetical protein THAOC_30146 [Thalassiosira oceanica]|uniref:Uncharacterized protein n=1 Tax=Thalassiosira oceanica TaxID=159749 RepID=K0RET8_THAOC|nr:hypothetical protein THAOC_30146 [Thalassiosira oceanica]|eukprot:EJK50759.1 hypothetical protein THAOC_30146 [Thalassiosira oceanica]
MVSKKQQRAKERQDRKARNGWVAPLTSSVKPFTCKGGGRVARYSNTGCCHGCTFIPPPDHELSTFMNRITQVHSRASRLDTVRELAEIWNSMPALHTDPGLRSQAMSLLLRLGINTILAEIQSAEGKVVFCSFRVMCIAQFLIALEPKFQDDPNSNDFASLICSSAESRSMKLLQGNIRDVFKFLHKKAKRVDMGKGESPLGWKEVRDCDHSVCRFTKASHRPLGSRATKMRRVKASKRANATSPVEQELCDAVEGEEPSRYSDEDAPTKWMAPPQMESCSTRSLPLSPSHAAHRALAATFGGPSGPPPGTTPTFDRLSVRQNLAPGSPENSSDVTALAAPGSR